MCLPLWSFASCVLNVIQAANKSHSMEYGVASKTRSVGSRSKTCIRVEIRQTHENPGKNQSQTEHKKHYRTLFRRDFDLGFHGVASLCTVFAFPESRLNGCRLMSMSLCLAIANSRWMTNSLNRSGQQSLDD
jgi:hypothetical protein